MDTDTTTANPALPPTALSNVARAPRTDGDATRARIIDVAGTLFAEAGFEATTSKAICRQAQVNMAAVNYHFGSREGLYRAVLRHVFEYLVDFNGLQQLAQAPLNPEQKLERIIHSFTELYGSDNWCLRLYLREVLTASEQFLRIFETDLLPRAKLIWQILADLANIPVTDPRIPHLFITTVAPCVMPLLANPKIFQTIYGSPQIDPQRHAQTVSAVVIAGLRALNAEDPPKNTADAD